MLNSFDSIYSYSICWTSLNKTNCKFLSNNVYLQIGNLILSQYLHILYVMFTYSAFAVFVEYFLFCTWCSTNKTFQFGTFQSNTKKTYATFLKDIILTDLQRLFCIFVVFPIRKMVYRNHHLPDAELSSLCGCQARKNAEETTKNK